MLEQIKIKKLNHAKNLDLPKYETPGSAGMDLCAAIQREITLEKNQYKLKTNPLPNGFCSIQTTIPDDFFGACFVRLGGINSNSFRFHPTTKTFLFLICITSMKLICEGLRHA